MATDSVDLEAFMFAFVMATFSTYVMVIFNGRQQTCLNQGPVAMPTWVAVWVVVFCITLDIYYNNRHTIRYPSGGYYDGDVDADGQPHGRGVQMSGDGKFSYAGTFRHGVKDGFGKATLSDGGVYEGEWYRDMRHGYGTYVRDGSTYTGQWSADKAHGHGTLNRSNGVRMKGEWKDGMRHGQFKVEYPDGKTEEYAQFDRTFERENAF